MEQVLHEQHADEMVEVVGVDGEVAVTRPPHGPRHVGEADRGRQADDVDPGRHHLACRCLAQGPEPARDLQLLLRRGGCRGVRGALQAQTSHRGATRAEP